jgi:hypothetical protein
MLPMARAEEAIHGSWSITTTIHSLYSVATKTMVKLNGTTVTCGNEGYWVLLLDDTTVNKGKHAMLMAAFLAGKPVQLRCENS